MNHYDYLPDTTVYVRDVLHDDAHRPGPYRCGCNPAFGASCRQCRGDDVEAAGESQWAAICAVRDAWRDGELTARDYYHRSAATSFDGLPSPDAAAALSRAEQAETRGDEAA